MTKEVKAKCRQRVDLYVMLSFFILIACAIFQYIRLWDYMPWEDETLTLTSAENFIREGVPRKGFAKDSLFYLEGYNYGYNWPYFLEVLLRAPIQVIANACNNWVIQTFAPLAYTVVFMIIVLVKRAKISEDEKMVIASCNITISMSSYIMSSYHYIRYYWFVIAATYICMLLATHFLRDSKSNIKKKVVALIVAMIPFLFHSVGITLFAVIVLWLIFILLKNMKGSTEDIKGKIWFIGIGALLIGFMVFKVLKSFSIHGFSISDIDFNSVIVYLSTIFLAGSYENYWLIVVAVIVILTIMLYREKTFAYYLGRVALLYLTINAIMYLWIGRQLTNSRYYISSHLVYAVLLGCFCYICYKKVTEKIIFRSKTDVKSTLIRIACSIFIFIFVFLGAKGIFLYYPGWGVSWITRDKVEWLEKCFEETNPEDIYVVGGDSYLTEYIPEIKNYIRFRTENKVDSYKVIEGRYYQENMIPIIGSFTSYENFLESLDENDYLVFVGCKDGSGEYDFVEYLRTIGVFDEKIMLSAEEHRELYEEYKSVRGW